jgi:uncharacterized sodium:solute symporter family permease YidK
MIAYTAATFIVFLICFLAYRSKPEKYADLMGVSALLSMAFVIGNLIVTMYHFPEAILASPVLDFFLAGMVYRAWQKNREPWKVVMVGALVAQLMLHVVAISMWKLGGLTQQGLYLYVVAINAFFIVQLLALGCVGVGHGLDRVRAYLSDRRGSGLVADARK